MKTLIIATVILLLSIANACGRSIHTTNGKLRKAKFIMINKYKGFLIKHTKGQSWVHLHELKKRSDRNLFLLPDVQEADGTVHKCAKIFIVNPKYIYINKMFTRGKTGILKIMQEDLSPWWRYKLGYTRKKTGGSHDVGYE